MRMWVICRWCGEPPPRRSHAFFISQGLDLRTLKFSEGVNVVKVQHLSLRGNKHMQMDESFLKRLFAPGRGVGKFKHSSIAGCNTFMSVLAHQQNINQNSTGSTSKKASKGTSGETSPKRDDKPTQAVRQGPAGIFDRRALNSARESKSKELANQGPENGGNKTAAVTYTKISDVNPHDNAKNEASDDYDNAYFDTYVVSLSATLAAAFLSVENDACDKIKLLFLCSENEHRYCREKVDEVGMCAKLAAQSENVSVFCEEDVEESETCHEHFDPAVPSSICRPSCRDSGTTSRFSLDWNASGAPGCDASMCEPSSSVFCERGSAKGLGCNSGDCLDKFCQQFTFGSGLERHSDYMGSGF